MLQGDKIPFLHLSANISNQLADERQLHPVLLPSCLLIAPHLPEHAVSHLCPLKFNPFLAVSLHHFRPIHAAWPPH